MTQLAAMGKRDSKPSLLDACFAANRTWAREAVERDPQFFERL